MYEIEVSGKTGILTKDIKYINEKTNIFGSQDNLIPQCFWGNMKDPEIIILAKNPSYNIDDVLDNKHFENTFKENLKISDRDESIVNILFSGECKYKNPPFELSGVSKWWRTFFGDNLEDFNPNTFMNNICILNLCGYYKTSVEGRIPKEYFWFNKGEAEYNIIDKLFTENEKLKIIISVWALNDANPWKSVLKDLGVPTGNIYIAQKKTPYKPHIKKLSEYEKIDYFKLINEKRSY